MKSTFIPSSFRPEVRGGRLGLQATTLNQNLHRQAPQENRKRVAIVFGPKEDMVVKLLERNVLDREPVRILYYEDLGIHWNYRLTNGHLEITTRFERLSPSLIYVRGTVVEPDHPMWIEIGQLFDVINAWKGEVLCRPSAQTYNESKPFQMLRSLRVAAQRVPEARVKVVPSYLIKSPEARLQNEWIVKSISGVRSLVASADVFREWNQEALKWVPSLFQKRVHGSDVRVHFLKGQTWGIQVQSKNEVDYRYASERSEMKEFLVPESLTKYCTEVARIEGGDLFGFDFLWDGTHFHCLEANPGPGWAWYHEHEVCSRSFLSQFLSVLKDSVFHAQ